MSFMTLDDIDVRLAANLQEKLYNYGSRGRTYGRGKIPSKVLKSMAKQHTAEVIALFTHRSSKSILRSAKELGIAVYSNRRDV